MSTITIKYYPHDLQRGWAEAFGWTHQHYLDARRAHKRRMRLYAHDFEKKFRAYALYLREQRYWTEVRGKHARRAGRARR